MNSKEITSFAKRFGYDGARLRGKWKHFSVYEPTSKNAEVANIGKPEFIFVYDGIIRMATEDEVFEYIDSLPEE